MTKFRRIASTAIGVCWLVLAGSARAVLVPLSEPEQSHVMAVGLPEVSVPASAIGAGIVGLLPEGGFAVDPSATRLLSREQFLGKMAAAGIDGLETTIEPGQVVTEVLGLFYPRSFSFSLTNVLAPFGMRWDASKMGTILIVDLDLSGSRFWIWPHRSFGSASGSH